MFLAATTSTSCLGVSSDHREGIGSLGVCDWFTETAELLNVMHLPRNAVVGITQIVVGPVRVHTLFRNHSYMR